MFSCRRLVSYFHSANTFQTCAIFLGSRVVQNCSLQNRLSHVEKKTVPQLLMYDLRKFEQLWRKQRYDEIMHNFFFDCLSKDDGSFSYVFNLIFHACDHCRYSPDLVFSMVVAFDEYIRTNNTDFSPTLIQKTEVLSSVLNYKNYQLTQLVCDVFKIKNEASSFTAYIDELVQQQNLIEAAYCIGALNLQQQYSVNQIALPLLLDDKVTAAMSYLSNQPDLQIEVAEKLDSLLDMKKTASRTCRTNVNSRKLFKTLTTLVNSFKISPERCKNLHLIRSKGALNILIRKRGQTSEIDETWLEMVMAIVRDNKELREHVVKKLISRKYLKAAMKMAEILNCDIDLPSVLPEDICDSDSNVTEDGIDELEAVCEGSDEKYRQDNGDSNHLAFALTSSDIRFICTKEGFFDCVSDISQNYNILGIDSEWKPHFGLSEERLSLIQLAVHDKVYILDMLYLNECLDTKDWDMFMNEIFGNSKIIKLGCGIIADVQMVVKCHRGTEGKSIKFSHMLDMALFYQKFQEIYPEEMKCNTDEPSYGANKGLSKLCEILLGKPLNKEERLCNWEQRPLKDSQLEYAALDAHCLLQMFDKLKKIAEEKDMNFDHLSRLAIYTTTELLKPKGKLKGVKKEDLQAGVPIHRFKVVIDSKLEFLGRNLRRFGADVVILKSSDTASTALQISKSEGRIIICSYSLWRKVHEKAEYGFCYNASSTNHGQATVFQILKHFKVKFSAQSIFSRCIICNNEEGVRLLPEDLKVLAEQQIVQKCLESGETCLEENCIEKSDLKYLREDIQTVIDDMSKSGITIKCKDLKDNLLSDQGHAFLCIKCGNVQME